MWRFGVACGGIAWLLTIGASGAINFLAGFQLGRTDAEATIFALLGVSADAWKALGPLFINALWRTRRRIGAVIALAIWGVCFAVALTAAIGLAAEVRSVRVGGRVDDGARLNGLVRDLAEAERGREARANVRSSSEIAGAIQQALAQAVGNRGTVGRLSEGCQKDTPRTRESCAAVAALHVERASALERDRLDVQIASLREQITGLRKTIGSGAADLQADLISRLSFGVIAANDVGLGTVLLLVSMIELVSAFGPLVIVEYAAAQRGRRVGPRRGRSGPGAARRGEPRRDAQLVDLVEYLAARVRPDPQGRIAMQRLFADYQRWCAQLQRRAMDHTLFTAAMDQVGRAEMNGSVVRRGFVCYGLALRSSIEVAG